MERRQILKILTGSVAALLFKPALLLASQAKKSLPAMASRMPVVQSWFPLGAAPLLHTEQKSEQNVDS